MTDYVALAKKNEPEIIRSVNKLYADVQPTLFEGERVVSLTLDVPRSRVLTSKNRILEVDSDGVVTAYVGARSVERN